MTILNHTLSFFLIICSSLTHILGVSSNLSESELLSVVNRTRVENQLNPLHPNPKLMSAAKAKAEAMIAANAWSHNLPSATPWQFLDSEGYVYTIAGENLATGFEDSEKLVSAWMNSASHRQNLLERSYTDTGIAVVYGPLKDKENTSLVVQYLAKPHVTDEAIQSWKSGPMIENSFPVLYIIIFLLVFITVSIVLFFIARKLYKQKYATIPPPLSHWKK